MFCTKTPLRVSSRGQCKKTDESLILKLLQLSVISSDKAVGDNVPIDILK